MEHWKEMILQSVAAILFCSAIVLFFSQMDSYLKLVAECRKQETSLIYEQDTKTVELCEYKDVIGSLMNSLEYDIIIDGYVIEHEKYSKEMIWEYTILHTRYQKKYSYTTNGTIASIEYRSVW